jgi:flagellar protein FliJ
MFTFRLQSVLDVRQVLEEKALVAFSDEHRRLAQEKQVLAALRRERVSHVDQLRETSHRSLRADQVSMLVSYLDILRKKIAAQQQVVHQATLAVETKRAELLDAMKKKKVMERLKEKQLAEFRREMGVRERRDLDEMAVLRFARSEE